MSTQAQLGEQMRALTQAQQMLQSETSRLSRALRSPNVRGPVGRAPAPPRARECRPDRGQPLRAQGIDQTEDGRLTPDAIVKLPGGKNVVLDAKVPLSAYLEAAETDDETKREAKLRDHARQVKDHVTRLANKSYWAHFQPDARHRRDVRAGRVAADIRAAGRSVAARIQHDQGSDAGQPADPDCAAPRDRLRMAAGDDRQERAGDQRPRASALRSDRQAGGALRWRRAQPRARGAGLQRRGRHAGEPGAGDGAAAEGQRRHARRPISPSRSRSTTHRGRSARRSWLACSTTSRSKGRSSTRANESRGLTAP